MINSFDNGEIFTASDNKTLEQLGLCKTGDVEARKCFGGLMLAPVIEISQRDDVTSPAEFGVIEEYIKVIEREFELASKEELESIGTEMGLLPMVASSWPKERFVAARTLLAATLDRLEDDEAHQVRNAIARACLDVAKATGASFISLHMVSEDERPLLHEIVRQLRLDTTAEGLNLLGKSR